MRPLVLFWLTLTLLLSAELSPTRAAENPSLVEELLARIIRSVDQDYAKAKYLELVDKYQGIDKDMAEMVHYGHPDLETQAMAIVRKHYKAVCKVDGIKPDASAPPLTLAFLVDLNKRSPTLRQEMMDLVFKEHPRVLGDVASLIVGKYPDLVGDLLKVGLDVAIDAARR